MTDLQRQKKEIPAAAVEDECDLDDLLDNVLDDFSSGPAVGASSAASGHATPPSLHASGSSPDLGRSSATTAATNSPEKASAAAASSSTSDAAAALEEEFAKQLAAGMEELVQNMGPEGAEFQKTMEQMIKQLAVDGSANAATAGASAGTEAKRAGTAINASASASASTTNTAAADSTPATTDNASKPSGTGSFQDKVTETLNKLKSSSNQVNAELAEGSADDLLADMMRQMGDMTELGDMDNLLEGMMEQLMSKDILYEPLSDLSKKYPKWLDEHKSEIPAEEFTRYEKQHKIIKEIIAYYERPDFDDSKANETDAQKIVSLMQAMQECGQPPKDILEDLAPGFEVGENGQAKLPDGSECNIM